MAEVFISYSRKDIAFARLLHEALTQDKVETWIDWARIPVGEKWWDEISAAIAQSEIFLFIISSHSIGSEVCRREIDQALSHNKRIIPVIVDDTQESAIREFVPDLTAINWIIFKQDNVFLLDPRPDDSLKPEEQLLALPKMPQFRQAVEKLNTAIHTDWNWVKAQTRLETRAQEWERRNRDRSWLLRGKDLGEAEGWLAQAGAKKDPQPTALQRQYVLASRKAETRRQRITLTASLGALAITIILGVLALLAQQTALRNLERSENLRLSAEAENILANINGNVETAALLSLRALQGGYIPQADDPLQKSMLHLYSIRTFNNHTDAITSVAFSPDGKYILTGGMDHKATLWDTATNTQVRTFDGHTETVESVAFSPDGKFVLTGSADKTAVLWETATGIQLYTFRDPPNPVERTSVEMKRSNHCVAFSPDGGYVLTGSDDGIPRLWDVASGALVRTFDGHKNIVRSVAFSPDGKLVLTGSLDGTARIWDVNTGNELRRFLSPNWILSVAFSPDGRYVLAGSTDVATLWDTASGEEVTHYSGDALASVSSAFSPDGRYLLTVGLSQSSARLWDVESGTLVRTFSGHTDTVTSVSFSPNGNYVLTSSLDGTAKLWDASKNAQVRSFIGHTDKINAVAYSPYGNLVLTGSDDQTARLWDATSKEFVRSLNQHNGAVVSVAFSPDEKYGLTGSSDGTAILWEIDTGTPRQTYRHGMAITSVAFSPDSQHVLTGSLDGIAALWDAISGEQLFTLQGHTQAITGVAFSPDGKYILTGSADWDTRLWDAVTGVELLAFKGSSSVQAVAFSPDGKYILTGDLERTATLWDIVSGEISRVFSGHTGYVVSVAFSPDGKYILTGSYDYTAKLWETATGKEVRTFSGHTDNVVSVAFSPDGNHVLLGSADMTADLRDVAFTETILWACNHLTRDLTPAERAQHFILDDKATCPQRMSEMALSTVDASFSSTSPLSPEKTEASSTDPNAASTPVTDFNLLDDFNDPANTGEFSSDRWAYSPYYRFKTKIEQVNGALVFSRSTSDNEEDGQVQTSQSWSFGQANFIEAKLKVDSQHSGTSGNLNMAIVQAPDGSEWYTTCAIQLEDPNPYLWCIQVTNGDSFDYERAFMDLEYDQWYTLRIEMDVQTAELRYYLDGELLDRWQPTDIEGLKKANFIMVMGASAGQGTGMIGYIDDVMIGK